MMLKGKVVLVTGAGTGIGAATCRQVVQEGGRVVLMGRRPEAINAVAATIDRDDSVFAYPGMRVSG